MIRFLALLLLLFALPLAACEPDAWSVESNTSGEENDWNDDGQSLSAQGPGQSGLEQLPVVHALLDRELSARSEFTVYDEGQFVHAVREDLHSAGDGRLQLILRDFADSPGLWRVPSVADRYLHEQRQLFLARYRGIELRNAGLAKRNYVWSELAGGGTVAGRPVDGYLLDSLFDIGDVELWVDQETELLLSWRLFTPSGALAQEWKVTQLDLAPDHQGIAWTQANVPTEAYDGLGAGGLLGFDPLELTSSGPGFEASEEKVLLAGQVFQNQGHLHLMLLNDGVRCVAIAQEETGAPNIEKGLQARAFTMRCVESGGVSVVDGKLDTKWVYAVGTLVRDDLLALLSALQRA